MRLLALTLWLGFTNLVGAAEPKPAASTNATTVALEYKLTGLVRQDGVWRVFLVRHEANHQRRLLELGEGEQFEGLEILGIRSGNGSVRVRYEGIEGEMTFKSHGVRPIYTVEDQGKEFVQVNRKFVNDHVRAHEERYRTAATAAGKTNSTTQATPNSR